MSKSTQSKLNFSSQLTNLMTDSNAQLLSNGLKNNGIAALTEHLEKKPHHAFVFRLEADYLQYLISAVTINKINTDDLHKIKINTQDELIVHLLKNKKESYSLATTEVMSALNTVLEKKFNTSLNHNYEYVDGKLTIKSRKVSYQIDDLCFYIFQLLFENRTKLFKMSDIREQEKIKSHTKIVNNPKLKLQAIFKHGDSAILKSTCFQNTGMNWQYKPKS